MSIIVLVEDSKPDAQMVETVLMEQDSLIDILWFKNGQDCLDFFEQDQFTQKCIEHKGKVLILLDLNMPRMGGIELLKSLQRFAICRNIPKIVYTTSNASSDIKAAYENGASGYVVKAFDLKEIEFKLGIISKYWLEVVEREEIDTTKWI